MAWRTYLTDTGTGLLSGAATGASIGSLFPGPGTVIGAIGGGLIGGLSGYFGAEENAERLEQADALASGILPVSYKNHLANQLSGHYDQMRHELGGYLGRSGLTNSTIAGRIMADTYTEQSKALTNALAAQSLQGMGFGHDLLAQRRSELGQIGMGIVNTVGLLHELRNSQPQKPTVSLGESPFSVRSPILTPRGYGTQRGGGFTHIPKVNSGIGSKRPALSGGSKLGNTFSQVRSKTGASRLTYPSFTGR